MFRSHTLKDKPSRKWLWLLKITLAVMLPCPLPSTPLQPLTPSQKPVNGLSLTPHNGGFQGRLKRGYGWWIGFLVSSLGSQTEFRLAVRGSSTVISSARFVPCLQDILSEKKKKRRDGVGKKKEKLHGIWLMRGLLSRGYNLMVDLLIYKPL